MICRYQCLHQFILDSSSQLFQFAPSLQFIHRSFWSFLQLLQQLRGIFFAIATGHGLELPQRWQHRPERPASHLRKLRDGEIGSWNKGRIQGLMAIQKMMTIIYN